MGWLNEFNQAVIQYFTNEQMWQSFFERVLTIIFILVGTVIIVRIGRAVLRKIFQAKTHTRLKISERRETTLEKLTENVFSYVAYFIAFLMIVDQFVDVKALIAGAGIAGLAIGFGAQNLVRDVISGFFIIFEDQFSVGDYIRTGQFVGTVEEIGLRTTKIKSWTGELHILPNGSVTEVTNYSIHNSLAVVDVRVAYEEDVDQVEKLIEKTVKEMAENYEEIVGETEVLGVERFGASDVVIRVTAEVLPMEHFYIAREIRKTLKQRFDEKGIEIPYPRLVTFRRDEKTETVSEGVKDGNRRERGEVQ